MCGVGVIATASDEGMCARPKEAHTTQRTLPTRPDNMGVEKLPAIEAAAEPKLNRWSHCLASQPPGISHRSPSLHADSTTSHTLHLMAVFFARMVIPRSLSRALLSITRTAMSCCVCC